jgi:hypothetical protein
MSKQENERHRQALQALADAKAVRAWESKRSEMEAAGGHPSGIVPAAKVDPDREWCRINAINMRCSTPVYPRPLGHWGEGD